MLPLTFAEVSETGGSHGDGIMLGTVGDNQIAFAAANIVFSTNISALRKDTIGGVVSWADITADAESDMDNQCQPWSATDVGLSVDDELWIADGDVGEIYVKITTPGQWTGAGLGVYESLDGETLVPVTGLIDNSNGLRNAAGIYKISFNGWENRKAISPVFGMTKKKYVVLKPEGFTAGTVTPKLSRMWVIKPLSKMQYTEITTQVNAAVTDETQFLPATSLHVPGAVSIYGTENLAIGVTLYLHKRYASDRLVKWQFLADGGVWTDIVPIRDRSNGLVNGPNSVSDPMQTFYIRWALSGNAKKQELTLPMADGSTVTKNLYWIRLYCYSAPNPQPIASPIFRVRSASLNPSTCKGLYHQNETSYSSVMFENGVASTTDSVICFMNATTGVSRTVTIPALMESSSETANNRLSFTSPLSVMVGESIVAYYVTGGTIRDTTFYLD